MLYKCLIQNLFLISKLVYFGKKNSYFENALALNVNIFKTTLLSNKRNARMPTSQTKYNQGIVKDKCIFTSYL